MQIKNGDKFYLSLLTGLLASISQKYSILLFLVLVSIIFDVVTGLAKCVVSCELISSKKGTKGFIKKLMLIVAFVFGIFLDFFVPYLLQQININLPFNSPFGFVFGCYIVLNECISIMENLFACNPQILPKWVLPLFKEAKEKINKKADDENGGDKNGTDL